jgi:short subunit dehydrogenase-like uncharacterized protein
MSEPASPSAPPTAEQTGPIVVYAASGYTGKLISHELARRGADFVLAGRSRQKLEALANELGGSPPVAAVPLDDPAGLRELLEPAAAVISCAGPFTVCGDAIVEAAVETGTHYVDTTGEQPFIRRVFDRHGPGAESRGAALLSGMGFDYAPGDLLAALTAKGLESIDELTVAYSIRGFGPTRGTALSALEMISGGDVEWVGGVLRPADRSTGRGRFGFPPPIGTRRVGRYPAGEQITVPRHVPVRRVRTLIDLRSLIPAPMGPLAAAILTASGYAMSTPLSRLVAKLITKLPEGPDPSARAAVAYTLVCEVRTKSGLSRRGVLRGSDVYGITAVTTTEAALRMAAPGYDRSGALAPAQAFDPAGFLGALEPHGVSYSIG